MILLLMAGASCYGILYGIFCMKKRRIGPGIGMIITGLFPLGLGILLLLERLF